MHSLFLARSEVEKEERAKREISEQSEASLLVSQIKPLFSFPASFLPNRNNAVLLPHVFARGRDARAPFLAQVREEKKRERGEKREQGSSIEARSTTTVTLVEENTRATSFSVPLVLQPRAPTAVPFSRRRITLCLLQLLVELDRTGRLFFSTEP